MVRFFINKDAPGSMRAKLVTVFKRIAYQKVELNVDPSLEAEAEEDAAEDGADADGATATPIPAALDAGALTRELTALARRLTEAPNTEPALKASLVKCATDANASIKAGSLDAAAGLIAQLRTGLDSIAPSPPTGTPDAASLLGELGGLARKITSAAADPALRGMLAKLAIDAQAALKANDTVTASGLIARLLGGLDAATATSPTSASDAAPATQIWNDAKEAADQQLNQLYATLRKTGLPVLTEVAGEIEAVLGKFRTGLVSALINYDQAAGSRKENARVNALRVVEDYQARLTAWIDSTNAARTFVTTLDNVSKLWKAQKSATWPALAASAMGGLADRAKPRRANLPRPVPALTLPSRS